MTEHPGWKMSEESLRGWVHEHPSSLEPREELDLMERSVELLTKQAGQRPVGYRAPAYDVHAHTFDILKRLGFLYDSSLMADDRPYEILAKDEPSGLVELPVEWIRDDATLLDPRSDNFTTPRRWLQSLVDESELAYDTRPSMTPAIGCWRRRQRAQMHRRFRRAAGRAWPNSRRTPSPPRQCRPFTFC